MSGTNGAHSETRAARSTIAGVAISVALHAGAVVWLSSAWAQADGTQALRSADESHPERERPEDEIRLGIESSQRATINWLGFSDPAPHRATESEYEQAALVIAPPGAPEPPSAPSQAANAQLFDPAEPTEQGQPTEQSSVQDQPVESAGTPSPEVSAAPDHAGPPTETSTPVTEGPIPSNPETESKPEQSAQETASESADTATEPEQADESTKELSPAAKPEQETQSEPSASPAPPEQNAGADSMRGILSDRESTPTSKPVNLQIRDWGRPAAGEGVRVNPVRPRIPDTVAVSMRLIRASVLIDFGADGRVRDVRWATRTVERRLVTLHTGNPMADTAILNAVHNWTASGTQIEALADRGPDAVLTVQMDIRIRP